MTSKQDYTKRIDENNIKWNSVATTLFIIGCFAYIILGIIAFFICRDDKGNLDLGKFSDGFGILTSVVTGLGFLGLLYNAQQVQQQIHNQQQEIDEAQAYEKKQEFFNLAFRLLDNFQKEEVAFKEAHKLTPAQFAKETLESIKLSWEHSSERYHAFLKHTEDLYVLDWKLNLCVDYIRTSDIEELEKRKFVRNFVIPVLAKEYDQYLTIRSYIAQIDIELGSCSFHYKMLLYLYPEHNIALDKKIFLDQSRYRTWHGDPQTSIIMGCYNLTQIMKKQHDTTNQTPTP